MQPMRSIRPRYGLTYRGAGPGGGNHHCSVNLRDDFTYGISISFDIMQTAGLLTVLHSSASFFAVLLAGTMSDSSFAASCTSN